MPLGFEGRDHELRSLAATKERRIRAEKHLDDGGGFSSISLAFRAKTWTWGWSKLMSRVFRLVRRRALPLGARGCLRQLRIGSCVSGSEDEELIAAYRDSLSSEVLDELLRRHVGRVRALLFQMVLDDGAADDLTQEVFLRVVRHLPTFDGRARFSTWLYRVAMNTCHSYLEREGRLRIEFREELPERCGAGSGPAQAVLDAELQREIETALAGLPPGLRAAIVLTAVQGLEPKEAARIENCSTATMYWRVHQARKRLAERLQGYL